MAKKKAVKKAVKKVAKAVARVVGELYALPSGRVARLDKVLSDGQLLMTRLDPKEGFEDNQILLPKKTLLSANLVRKAH